MSIEPTCDFCGTSDKFRCKTTMDASGCESYREKNRIMASMQKPALTGKEVSMTIVSPKGLTVVREYGDEILVEREGRTLSFEPSEALEMIDALKTILNV